MRARLRTFGRCLASAACLVLWASAGQAGAGPTTSSPTSAAAQPARLTPPPADSVRAYDLPSDDGSTIVLEWAKPPTQVEGAFYVVEVARSPEGFQTGDVRTQVVRPSKGTLKSARPKYFGSKRENRGFYFAQISPAGLFVPFRLTPARVKAFLAEKALADAAARRALAILAHPRPEEQLTKQEKADREWLALLERSLSRRERMKGFLAAGLVSQADFDRAVKAVGNLKPADQLSAEEKTDRAWAAGRERSLARRDRLAKFLKRETIKQKHFDRATKALANEKPDARLTSGEKSDRKWLVRLEAYLARKDRDIQKARRKEVNSAGYCLRLAISAGDGGRTAAAYVSRDGQPSILRAGAKANIFKHFKLNNLVFALAFSSIVLIFIQIARRNPDLFIRKIAGLEAVEEAIGRATEMGRSVYFVHGLGAVGDLATIAALNILARVARRAAQYDTRVRVMNCDPIVTAVSQEVVQQAYTEAGRPDAYNADDVSLVASDQFSYVAAVSGMMVREQPAAVFLLGYFAAESLLLAETGASTGAIQVAGTDAYTQLPFFVTTCDYTLIGEELYAASAYLSREPRLLGSLRGQDVGKAFLIFTMIAVAVTLTVALSLGVELLWLRGLFKAY